MLKLMFVFLIALPTFARDVHVNGYYRQNGTYVQDHYRTAPDNTINNNYSTQGNYNPYTGKEGTKHPETYQNSWDDSSKKDSNSLNSDD